MNSLPNNGPISNASRGIKPGEASKLSGATDSSKLASSGPAFRALFEQLQEKAAALQESSKDVADPAELKGAVDTARATLDDALSLGDQILEAFRGAQHAGESASAGEHSNEQSSGPRAVDPPPGAPG